MALTGKKKEAADAIAAANPTWSKRHVEMCAEYLMPTTTAYCFEVGTKERVAAEQLFKERMHAFLVEMNILKSADAYVRPTTWVSPFTDVTPRAHRQTRARVPQVEQSAAPKESRASGEIREPNPASAGGKAWALCDAFFAENKRCPTPAECREEATRAGLNPGNVQTEASRWRKFRGYRQ